MLQFPGCIINKLVLAAIWALSETQGSETGLGIKRLKTSEILAGKAYLTGFVFFWALQNQWWRPMTFSMKFTNFSVPLGLAFAYKNFPNDPCFSSINLFIYLLLKSMILVRVGVCCWFTSVLQEKISLSYAIFPSPQN